MEIIRLHFVAVFIATLCVCASCTSQFNRKQLPKFQDVRKQTVEKFLSLCREEFTRKLGVAETLKSYLHQTLTDGYFSVSSDSRADLNLSYQEAEEFLDCSREENSFWISPSCEGIQSELIRRCPEVFRKWSFVPRRHLRNKKKKKGNKKKRKDPKGSQVGSNVPAPSPTETVDQVPAPSPSPISRSPSPSPNQSPAESPKLPVRKPVNSPKGSPPPKPHESRPPKPAPLIKQHNNSSQQAGHSPPSKQHNTESKNANNDNNTLVISAIAGGVVIVAALIAFFLFCLLKKGKNDGRPRDRNRDDNPLLNVYSGDLSAASSQKSPTAENSNNKDFKTSSTENNSSAEAGALGTTEAAASGDATNLPPPAKPVAPPPRPPPPKPPGPPPPPKGIPRKKPSPLKPNNGQASSNGDIADGDSDAQKAKMKPFFWDKVQANPDHSMVWHDIKSGSFQFNEELMESLFGYAPTDHGGERKKKAHSEAAQNYIQIIDPKKAQNLSILLRALNVTTEEVCDALNEGNELPPELVRTLIKMAPTADEELKLRLFSGDVTQIGPAERFLIVVVEIPFAFKRLESILFMSTFQEDLSLVKESFATLEVACADLKNSRIFLKLLEAVLKTGNRMNDGTYRGGANAFKIDTLLKLSDVKGTDGHTTLLHFVVQEISRSEGVRAARRLRENKSISSVETDDLVEECSQDTEEYHCSLGLQVISGVSNELSSVRKAAVIDGENVRHTVSQIGNSLVKTRNFLQNELENLEEESKFINTLASFVEHSEAEVGALPEEERRVMGLVKRTGDFFHGNSSKDEGLRLFIIVSDFLKILDKVCREVKEKAKIPAKAPKNEKKTASQSQDVPDLHKKLFPAIQERRASGEDDFSSSEDER